VCLFLAEAVIASTSFQPDPLMIMLVLAAALAVARHHEQPTTPRFALATVLTGAAILVKPVIAGFFLFPLFALLAIVRNGVRGAVSKLELYAFAVLGALIPTVLFYVYSSITNQYLSGSVAREFNPQLWRESSLLARMAEQHRG
jgi:4-amino-4-deoxy-L-arabinose transferase-like glycosyltransferase